MSLKSFFNFNKKTKLHDIEEDVISEIGSAGSALRTDAHMLKANDVYYKSETVRVI